MDHAHPVVLANPAEIRQYDGIKEAEDLTDAAFLARLARLEILPTGYIYPREDRPVRDLLRRRTLLVRQQTAMILSLQNLALRQTGQRMDWRTLRDRSDEERTERLGDHDCPAFVTSAPADLIQLLREKIKRFAKKVLEHAHLKPAYTCLLTLPGVGVILARTIMLETGDIGRFETVGDCTSYCRCVRATHTSNGKNKGKHNRKNGNAYPAWAFVEAAHQALKTCPQAKRFYDHKRAQRHGALATKALAAKWSKAAYYMRQRQETFDLTRVFG